MCSPALVVAGISVAGSLASSQQQQRAGRAQMEAVRQQQLLDREALLAQRKQLADEASAKAFDAQREAMIEEGRLIAAGSEAGGVGAGLQVRRLLQAHGFETGTELARIGRDADNKLEQNARALTSIDIGAANQIRTISAGMPDTLSATLSAASAGAAGFQTGQALDPLMPSTPTVDPTNYGPVEWT